MKLQREGVALYIYLDRVHLVNPWSEVFTVSPECDCQPFQELVHAHQEGRGAGRRREGGREGRRERERGRGREGVRTIKEDLAVRAHALAPVLTEGVPSNTTTRSAK